MQIVLAVIATGVPGMFSYWYLSQLGIFRHTEDTKDDKVLVTLALSFLNILMSLFVFSFIYMYLVGVDLELLMKRFLLTTFELFLISCTVTYLLTRFVYPNIIKSINKAVENHKNENGIDSYSNYELIEEVIKMRPKDKKYIFIYVFDFNNRFIESGYLSMVNVKRGQLLIAPNTGYEKEIITYGEVLSILNKVTESTSGRLILDYDKQIKIVAIYD